LARKIDQTGGAMIRLGLNNPPGDFPGRGEIPVVKAIQPTSEEAAGGWLQLQQYIPDWKANPGIYIEKDPDRLLIVSLEHIDRDNWGFSLALGISDVISGAGSVDPSQMFHARCIWNQPYMHFDARGVMAPYSFDLCFGAAGVARFRELRSLVDQKGGREDHLLLRHCARDCFDKEAAASLHDFIARNYPWPMPADE
jgi:hypothetical protein